MIKGGKSEKPPGRKTLPPFEALRAFDAVARLGGVRKAANWLSRDHAVISRHLRAIEDWTGVNLLERTPTGIVLTHEGEVYHHEIAEALDQIARATLDILNRGHHDRLHIWSVPGFALFWLSRHIGAFETENRSVDIEIRPTDISPDFGSYEGDADIRFEAQYEQRSEPSPLLSSCDLAKAEVIAVASPEYLRNSPQILSPRDLLSHQLLHENAFLIWADWLASYGVNENVHLTGPRLWQGHLTLDGARHDRGIALANELTASQDLAEGRLVRIGAGNPVFEPRYGHYVLYARKDRWGSPVLRRFRQWIIRTIGAELPHLRPEK